MWKSSLHYTSSKSSMRRSRIQTSKQLKHNPQVVVNFLGRCIKQSTNKFKVQASKGELTMKGMCEHNFNKARPLNGKKLWRMKQTKCIKSLTHKDFFVVGWIEYSNDEYFRRPGRYCTMGSSSDIWSPFEVCLAAKVKLIVYSAVASARVWCVRAYFWREFPIAIAFVKEKGNFICFTAGWIHQRSRSFPTFAAWLA